jgi:RNA polymerase sigma-70 factor, ECF subfamily
MTDSEIINKVLEGNRDLFRELVLKYQSMIFRICIGYVHNKDDAEDLTQDIFLNAFQSLPNFKGESSFSTWLYKIAINASLNKVRKTSGKIIMERLESFLSGDKRNDIGMMVPENENPDAIMIYDEQRKMVRKALDSLPENQRTAIVLSKYEELPQREIAEIMNISEGAVEALIQRSKSNLRKKLASLSGKNM